MLNCHENVTIKKLCISSWYSLMVTPAAKKKLKQRKHFFLQLVRPQMIVMWDWQNRWGMRAMLTYGRVWHDHHDVGVGREHVNKGSEVRVAHFHALEGGGQFTVGRTDRKVKISMTLFSTGNYMNGVWLTCSSAWTAWWCYWSSRSDEHHAAPYTDNEKSPDKTQETHQSFRANVCKEASHNKTIHVHCIFSSVCRVCFLCVCCLIQSKGSALFYLSSSTSDQRDQKYLERASISTLFYLNGSCLVNHLTTITIITTTTN